MAVGTHIGLDPQDKEELVKLKIEKETIEYRGDEAIENNFDITEHWCCSKYCRWGFMSITILIIFVFVLAAHETNIQLAEKRQYRGYCYISLQDKNIEMFEFNKNSNFSRPEIMNSSDANEAEQFSNALREELDITSMVEKISVFHKGQQVLFIHDFNTNITNIVDDDRCFFTELDLDMVMFPLEFLRNIDSCGLFNVTTMRTQLRMQFPAVKDKEVLDAVAAVCRSRATYRLRPDDSIAKDNVGKRSVIAKSFDYMHFSGKHINEMKIVNLEQLPQHEMNMTA